MNFNIFQREFAIAAVLDDHTFYAEAFAAFLEKTTQFKRVYSFTTDEQLLQFLPALNTSIPIILFTDYYLGDKTCLSLINDLRRLYAQLAIVIVSSVTNPVLINDILSYKIHGFLSKSSQMTEIVTCLQHIKQNKLYTSPFIGKIIDNYKSLEDVTFSGREIEILNHFAKGLTVIATAEKMILSKHTIVAHRRRMMAKTNTKSITELLAYARKIELI